MILDLEDTDEDHNLVSGNLIITKQVDHTTQQEDNHLLLQIPPKWWSSSDIGKIKSATPRKLTVDNPKP